MPLALQRYSSGEETGLPPWLAALWDFARRDPVPMAVGTIPSASLARHLPLLARAGSALGGFQPSQVIGDFLSRFGGMAPVKMLPRPVTGLPTATIARGQSALGDVNAPAMLADALSESFPVYLNKLAPRLVGPTSIEADVFRKLVIKYLMNALR